MSKVLKILQVILSLAMLAVFIFRLLAKSIDEPYRALLMEKLPLTGLVIGLGLIGLCLLGRFKFGQKLNPARWMVVGLAIMLIAITNFGGLLNFTYPADIKTTGPAIDIRVPMDGDVQVTWGGDTVRENYHAAHVDQRWAYDLVMEPHSLGTPNNEDYGCFGQTVFAPISGEIRNAIDGEPDRVPDDFAPDVENIAGNYIVIRPENTETRLVIGHLKQGSVIVEKGQFVTEGTPIGECGNSGNSTEPHVHLHHAAIHDYKGQSVVTGLPLNFRDHDGPRMPTGGLEGWPEKPVGDIIRHQGPQ